MTSVSAPAEWDLDEAAYALDDLRVARRRNRVAQVDLFDAFYKAYLTAVFGGIAVYGVAGWFGDAPIRGAALDDVRRQAPLYLGLLVAVAVAAGLRSGGRGGPLAFERAEVRHVLLSPVDRRDSIRKPALRQLRHAAFLGTTVGAAAGLIALRRLPELPVMWLACGALFGGALVTVAYGVAMIAGGRRLPAALTDTGALLVVAWAGSGVLAGRHTSPFSWLGEVAVWPLGLGWIGLAGLALAVVVATAGWFLVDGISIEAAERRSRLIGQLRFAATLQDVRTVMVLQRQLVQEHLRVKPRIRLRPLRRAFRRNGDPRLLVFVYRSLHGFLRWPLFRIARLFVLALIAGAALCGAWAGTGPLIVVTGIALWVMALDLLEPLAQDADRPDRLMSVARPAGWSHIRHLIVPGLTLFGLVVVAGVPAFVLGDPHVLALLTAPTLIIATVLPLAGAALAVTRPPTAASGTVASPEVAGLTLLWRAGMPPALGVVALVPLMFARDEFAKTGDAIAASNAMTIPWYVVLAIATWAIGWVRHGSEYRERMELSGAKFARGPETEKR